MSRLQQLEEPRRSSSPTPRTPTWRRRSSTSRPSRPSTSRRSAPGASIIQPSLMDFLSASPSPTGGQTTMQIQSTRFGSDRDRATTRCIEFPTASSAFRARATRSSPSRRARPSTGCTRSTIRRSRCRSRSPGCSSRPTRSRSPTRTPRSWASTRPSRPTSSASSAPPRSSRTSPSTCAGPIVVHAARRLGRQVINEAGDYDVRQPLFAQVELSQAAPANSTHSHRRDGGLAHARHHSSFR